MFCKKSVLKKSIKIASTRVYYSAPGTSAQMFSYKFFEILKKTYFVEHLGIAAFENKKNLHLFCICCEKNPEKSSGASFL